MYIQCTYVHTHTHTHIHTCTYSVHMYTHTHTHTHAYIRTYIHTYIYIQCTYVHIHTHTPIPHIFTPGVDLFPQYSLQFMKFLRSTFTSILKEWGISGIINSELLPEHLPFLCTNSVLQTGQTGYC